MRTIVLAIVVVAIVGCKGAPFIDHLAGTPLPSTPYFHHTELFVEGQDLHVGVDPNRYPTKVGTSYSVYVVEHKSPSQWTADPSLVDVTGSVETFTLTAGTLSGNTHAAWSGMSLPPMSHVWHKAYDVVFDFGSDGSYDSGTDILDRIGVLERPLSPATGGFTLAVDPATPGDFPVSTHEYDAGPFSVAVPAAYQETGDPLTINLIGKMYYPATAAGIDQPISTELSKYPLIIIAHGRHGGATNSYQGYGYLATHLASRGFICASVALNQLSSGWRIHHRGVTILKHVTTMVSDPTTDAVINNVRTRIDQDLVGLLGHSRGGEGVVAAQETYSGSPTPLYDIKAVASFSPTDGPNWVEASPGGGPYDPVFPYLMIYGTRDGDLSGYAGNTGFRIVDRGVRPRHMIAIYGANHNFFNTTWGTDGTPTITRTQQETLAKAFITPFFSNNLNNAQAYVEFYSGYVVAPSVSGVGTTVLYADQPLRWIHRTVDDNQDVPSGAATNSLGLANVSAGTGVFMEESLRYQTVPARNYYTHDTDGLRISWSASGATVTFGIGDRSIWAYDYLNFRVGQRFRSTGNLNPVAAQNLAVTLEDLSGNTSPPMIVSLYMKIPYTDNVGIFTKSIMQTVRIPIRAFAANGSPLDLRHVTQVILTFDQTATGELIIDDVEFLGLDISEPEL